MRPVPIGLVCSQGEITGLYPRGASAIPVRLVEYFRTCRVSGGYDTVDLFTPTLVGISMSNQNIKTNIIIKQEVEDKEEAALKINRAAQPGGVGDPLTKGLKKKARKRYNRYLREGMLPKEARVRAINPNGYQKAAAKNKTTVAPPAMKGGLKRKIPSQATTVAPKRAKKAREGRGPIDMAILATRYPLRLLTKNEATIVEKELVDEMLKGSSHSINFDGIHFKTGLIIVKCRDDRSKQWLELTVPKVCGIGKVQLRTCPMDDLPSMKIVTIEIPDAAEQKVQAAVRLLRKQNSDLDSDAWILLKCSNTKGGGRSITLGLQQQALELLQKNGMKMSYRFRQLPCRLEADHSGDGDDGENAMWYVDIPKISDN
ncbi:uncharacterized protein LOC6592052 [Drosophila persimilis]|uniref:uncharacterized protein LOC6592052 n=1 Tax=Drosophila persimilis TaxID=7234 RepID=UPI000F08E0A6|nr:uncharacterized protein LOC6592052 [Drosophila persimilis]